MDTSDALPLGTVTDVHIKKGAQLFEARARVVYSRATKGMGLVFTAIEPEHVRALETWLIESRETSWLAANRRRSQRVLMTIPVRVSGKSAAGLPFEEETHTRAISAHGALILVSTQVWRGQRMNLSNVQTKAALECVVAHIDKRPSDRAQVGVEFTLPNPVFIVDVVPSTIPVPPPGTALAITRSVLLPGGAFLVEFRTLLNRTYFVQYSSNLSTWQTAFRNTRLEDVLQNARLSTIKDRSSSLLPRVRLRQRQAFDPFRFTIRCGLHPPIRIEDQIQFRHMDR